MESNPRGEMRVTVLGCGSASPSVRHEPSAQAVEYRRRIILLDCGEGTQRAMCRAGLNFERVSDIFLTHLHGDHCLGLPGLLSTLALHQRGGKVTLHTFEDGAEIFSRVMDFFCRERSFELEFNILRPDSEGVISDLGGLQVEAVPLRHRVPCLGYILREKPKPRHLIADAARFHGVPMAQLKAIKEGADFIKDDGTVIPNAWLTTDADPSRAYAYCTDTAYFPELASKVRGVDVLYHEATYADDAADKARARHHSTAAQAAMTARDAQAGQLLIGHYSKQYRSEEEHLRQAQAIFPRTTLAQEGLQFTL